MLGWKLFWHALMMVLRNWREALHIASLPILVALFGFGGVLAFLPGDVFESPFPSFGGSIGLTVVLMFAYGLLVCAVMLGAAVNWHRFVLLEEETHWFMSPFRAGLTWEYFIQGAVIALMLIIPSVLVGSVGFAIFFSMVSNAGIIAELTDAGASQISPEEINAKLQEIEWRMLLVLVATFMFINWLFLKLAVALPATAIGEKLVFGHAFKLVRFGFLPAIVLTFCLSVLPIGIEKISEGLASMPAFGVVFYMVAQFIYAFFNVSILTTLYGYFIEKRDLV